MMPLAAPYLRTQRQFPSEDVKELSSQVDQAYIDIASKLNSRIIGLFPVNRPIVTGEKWYLTGSSTPQQTLRQVYPFTSTGAFNHKIPVSEISSLPRGFGYFTDGTNYYGAIYASSVAIAGQVTFYVTPTQIVVLSGSGAPSISSGLIVIEWLSQAPQTIT